MSSRHIVDSHVHLWNPTLLKYPWLEGLPALNHPALPPDFIVAQAPARVAKWIFVESGVEPGQSLAEVKWVASLAKKESRIKGIVAHAALEKGAAVQADLEQLAGEPLVKGVRRILQGESAPGLCLRPAFVEGVRQLAKFGFTFDLCIRSSQLPDVTELARKIPEVAFILDHCGKPNIRERQFEPWIRDLKAFAGLPNVACKISGLTTEADHQKWQPADLKMYLQKAVELFGFDRVLFGGDWPVATLASTYGRWLETVEQLIASASESDRCQLFQTNAERIYRV